MKIPASLILCLIFMIVLPPVINAQDGTVSSNLEVVRITTEDGEEIAEQVETIEPGDTLEYRLTYTNNRSDAITNLQPVLPIPDGIRYISDTAIPALSDVSLALGNAAFETLPIIRERETESGLLVEQEVPAREYKRLRWMVDRIPASGSVTVTARARVNSYDEN